MGNYYSVLLKVGLALCVGMIFHQTVKAQCSSGFSTRTYDTALTSNGFGTYTINAPQFSPDSGTLVSVKVSAIVSSQYGFTLKNASGTDASYSLTLGQDDQITGNSLSSPYSNVMSQLINSYALTPGQAVTESPFVFLNNHVSSDSITSNVAPFLGYGTIPLSYLSFTYTDLSTANNATYYYSANISNTITFSVQYLYCTAGNAVLATTLTNFTAALTAPHTAGLAWSAANENVGRIYDVQRSTDGKNFTTLDSVMAQGNAAGADYSYTDDLADSLAGDVEYRLQIHDGASVSYSAIQQIDIPASPTSTSQGFRIYPNPATNYINIATGQDANDWQVDIFAANGNLVQRSTMLQSTVLYIPFTTKLSAGTYFVRLTGLHGRQSLSTSFVIISGQ